MVTVDFRDDSIVMVVLSGVVSATDIDQAWSALASPRFSVEHDVIVDVRRATIGFSVSEIPPIIRKRDHLPQNAQGITCFVAQSHLAAAVVSLVKDLVRRRARWHVVSDIDSATARIQQRRNRIT